MNTVSQIENNAQSVQETQQDTAKKPNAVFYIVIAVLIVLNLASWLMTMSFRQDFKEETKRLRSDIQWKQVLDNSGNAQINRLSNDVDKLKQDVATLAKSQMAIHDNLNDLNAIAVEVSRALGYLPY